MREPVVIMRPSSSASSAVMVLKSALARISGGRFVFSSVTDTSLISALATGGTIPTMFATTTGFSIMVSMKRVM